MGRVARREGAIVCGIFREIFQERNFFLFGFVYGKIIVGNSGNAKNVGFNKISIHFESHNLQLFVLYFA